MAVPTGWAPNSVLSGLQSQYAGSSTPDFAALVNDLRQQQAMVGLQPIPEYDGSSDPKTYLQLLAAQDSQTAGTLASQIGLDLPTIMREGAATGMYESNNDSLLGKIGSLTRVGRGEVTGVGDFLGDAATLGAIGYGTSFLPGGGATTGSGSATVSGSTTAAGVAAPAAGGATTFPLATGGTITGSAIPGVTSGTTAAGATAAGVGTAVGASMPNWVNWANLGSTVLGLYGADRAADAQVAGSDAAIAESRRQYDTTRSDFQPAIKLLGESADALSRYNSGDMSGFFASPEHTYNLEQTTKAGERALASMGMRQSGTAVREAQRNASGLASRESNQFVNRLLAAAGLGTTGASTVASAGANSAANIGDASMNKGAARASGYANQFGALNGGVKNLLLQKYLRAA